MSNVEETIVEIERTAAAYRNPALLISFGKDSMALLDMLKHLSLPVICYQTPFNREKWKFANDTAAKYGVHLFDYPPDWVAMQAGPNDELEIVSAYTIGGKKVLGIRQGVIDDPHSGICGLHDCLKRPRGSIAFPWDLLISAQKNGDTDHFGGAHIITASVKQTPGSADVYFPLKDWTDEHILNYLEAEDVAIDESRYFRGPDGLRDHRENSPDWVSGCFACVRKDRPEVVSCPRLHGATVNNISASTPYIEHNEQI